MGLKGWEAILPIAVIMCFWTQGIHFGPELRRENFFPSHSLHPPQSLQHD